MREIWNRFCAFLDEKGIGVRVFFAAVFLALTLAAFSARMLWLSLQPPYDFSASETEDSAPLVEDEA